MRLVETARGGQTPFPHEHLRGASAGEIDRIRPLPTLEQRLEGPWNARLRQPVGGLDFALRDRTAPVARPMRVLE